MQLIEDNKGGWSKDEVERIFSCFKVYGTKWSQIVAHFPGRSENDIKNKFYTILKKVATHKQLLNPTEYGPCFIKCKQNLVQFVDDAIKYGYALPSKRGRKAKIVGDETIKENDLVNCEEGDNKEINEKQKELANELGTIIRIENTESEFKVYPNCIQVPGIYNFYQNPLALRYPPGFVTPLYTVYEPCFINSGLLYSQNPIVCLQAPNKIKQKAIPDVHK